MANTIKIKRSTVAANVPTSSDLEVGELAVNTADAKLYTKHSTGAVVSLGGGTVIDNLTSTSTTSGLSANQGRILKNQIDAILVILQDDFLKL